MKTKLQEQIGPADKLNHVVEKQVGRLSTGHVDVVLDGGGVIVLLKMCLRYKSADCTTHYWLPPPPHTTADRTK